MFFLLFLFLLIVTFQQNSVDITNRGINLITTYTVRITFNSSSLNPTGKLSILFPSRGYTNTQIQGINCNYNCEKFDLNVNINNSLIAKELSVINITLNNVINPNNTLLNQNLTVVLNTLNGTSNISISLGQFTPGVMKSCSIVISPGTVNTNSSALFTIYNTNPITNGKFVITFPSFWQGSSNNSIRALYSNTTCPDYLLCQYNRYLYYMAISNISIQANSNMTLNLSTLVSPPTSVTNNQILIRSLDFYSDTVDSNVNCLIPALKQNTLTINNQNINIVVNSNFTFSVNFINTDPIAINDVITITPLTVLTPFRPFNLIFSQTDINQTLIQNSLTYSFNITNSNSSNVTNIESGKNIKLSGLIFKSIQYSQFLPNAFTITLSRNNNKYSLGLVKLNVIANTLSQKTINSTIETVQTNSKYNLEFTTVTDYSPTSLIIIDITDNAIFVGCVTQLKIDSTSQNFNCTIENNTKMIISNFTSSNIFSGTKIKLVYQSRNPFTIKPSQITITIAYNSSLYNNITNEGIIDKGTVFFTAKPSKANCNISTIDKTIGKLTRLDINCSSLLQIPQSSQRVITLPESVLLSTPVQFSLFVNGTKINTGIITSTSQTITIKNVSFTNSLMSLQILNFRNPQTFSPTNSFIVITSFQNYKIQQILNGLILIMDEFAVFNSLQVSRESLMNGYETNYTFTLNSSIVIKNGYILKITIPQSITIINPQCNMECSINNKIISISFNRQYQYNEKIVITINGIKNPRTFATSQSFYFTLLNENVIYQEGILSGITNSEANHVLSFTKDLISPNQSYLNSTQKINFKATTTNSVLFKNGQYLSILFPSSFNISKSYCQSPYLCSSSGNIIKITSISVQQTVSVQLSIIDLIIPEKYSDLQLGTKFFTISSYTSANLLIDTTNSTTQIQFTLSCDSTCRTCSIFNKFQCTSCYSNATLLQNICNLCLNGQFKDQNGNCSLCSSSCKTCFGTQNNCTSCGNNFYLNNDNSSCVQKNDCPIQTIPLNNICQKCSQTCYSCKETTTDCVMCASGYLFRNSSSRQCILECDNGLVKFDGVCQCHQCLTCSSLYTNCTSCNPNTSNKYLFNHICLSQCPIKTYASSGYCLPCMQGCTVCTATQCQDDILNSLSNKLIPIPFTLAIFVVGVLSILSKLISEKTFIASFIISIGSVLQIICWIVIISILSYFEKNNYRIIGRNLIISGLAINYSLNIGLLFVFLKYLINDKSFNIWFRKQSSIINNRITLVLCALFSHKYIHIFFCKAFNSQSLSAPLNNPKSIVPVYIITGIGFISQILIIAGCANIAYDPKTYNKSQLFMESIDGIILSLIMIIFTSWNFIKPEKFFQPFEITKYNDRDEFKNNETIEQFNDLYLQNLEIQQVSGGVGGKAKYNNTRLHLQGLMESSLQKSKHSIVGNSMGKIVGDDPDSLIAHKLINKMINSELKQISQSSQDFDMGGSRQPLSPQKMHQKPKADVLMTNFEQNNQKSNNLQIDDQISISNDSLVRYENPLNVEQVDIIFSKNKKQLTMGKQYNSKNSQIFEIDSIDDDQQSPLAKKSNNRNFKRKSKRNKNANNNDPLNINQESSLSSNSLQQSYNQLKQSHNSQNQDQFNFPQNFDPQSVPELPFIISNQFQNDSTNLDNVPQTDIIQNWSNQNPTKTNYVFTKMKKSESKDSEKKNVKQFNNTTIGFRERNRYSKQSKQSKQQEEDNKLEEGQSNNLNNLNNLQTRHSNPNLPQHKFQKYFEDEDDLIFQGFSNIISQNKDTVSSFGSIRKTNNPRTDQDIKRDIVFKNILTPQTPIRIPMIPPTINSSGSITAPLETIDQHKPRSSFQSIKVQNPSNDKLKMYLQKLQIKQSKKTLSNK